jgi:hypothetical protein
MPVLSSQTHTPSKSITNLSRQFLLNINLTAKYSEEEIIFSANNKHTLTRISFHDKNRV